ncbi:hypothetical protein [Salibacter sp.]|uniref:hypothetical protein n=1 Tax=Salibacter sp. TaxID=2010995 RepID=UPI00286FEBE3|nr:hypothetical protein [Salibacter sp.]MDR9398905.1 hypothetical protein [Salibacter sp.]MDR9488553.1 hypothetical protein [Salibacter sp.]
MKTKNHMLTAIGVFIFLTSILSSCSTTDKVVSGNFIQKRKYNKGWHVNLKRKTPKTEAQEDSTEYLAETTNGKRQENNSDQTITIQELEWDTDNITAYADNSIIPLQNNTPVVFPKKGENTKEELKIHKERKDEECDVITLKNGQEIKAKILEIDEDNIKYKKCGKTDGPTYIKSKADILLIRYPDGSKDIFSDQNENKTDEQAVSHEKKSIAGWGIAGTILGIFIPLLGWIFGGIGLGLFNPEKHTEGSKTWSIVALVVSTVAFLIFLAILL